MDIKYKQQPKYWLTKVYHQQKASSVKRSHPLPTYTYQELGEWIEQNHSKLFHSLFDAWVASGFDKKLTPSLDRIDIKKPYTLCNLELVTWEVNELRYRTNRKENLRNKPVLQIDPDTGKVIAEFLSGALAADTLGFNQTALHRCARGERKTFKGYRWEYKGIPWVFNRK